VADIERARDQLVGDQAPRAERGRGRSERADAEGVEEVGDEAEEQALDQVASGCRERLKRIRPAS
jgi:hypothetical protein